MKYKKLLKKVFKYFLLGFSAVIILVALFGTPLKELGQRGPIIVFADNENYGEVGEANNGYDGGYEPLPSESEAPANNGYDGGYEPLPPYNPQPAPAQIPETPAPAQPVAPAPDAPAPQQPVCQPNPRQYNECIGNGASRRVEDDGCGNYRVVVGSQADSACGTVLQPYIPVPQGQAPAQPQPQPQPAPAPVIPQSNPVAPQCVPSNVNLSVNPNPTNVGGQITFNVSGSEGSTWINDTFDGGVSNPNGFWGSRTLTANNPGTFTWTHYWQNTAPNRTDIVSPLCQKSIQFTINQPVTPPPAQVLCPLTISASTINVNDSATYSLNTQNAPAGSTATWQGSNNGGSIPANPGFPVSFANSYSGVQHGGAGNYSRYIQILSNGQVVCTSNTVNLTVNQPFVPTPTPTPTPVPTATPTPAPTTPPQGAPTLRCPEGMTQTLEGNTIVCIQNIVTNTVSQTQTQTFNPTITVPAAQVITVPQPQIIYATNPIAQQVIYATPAAQIQPKVAYTAAYDVQSLPKTGLPLAGLGLGTLLPIGLRLKRFGKAKEMLSASSLWEERQFKI